VIALAVDNTSPADKAARRKSLMTRVQIGRKTLGILEDDYRALLERVTGHRSARDCDTRQLGRMMAEFERMGLPPSGRSSPRRPASSPVASKARAMWISLCQLGAITDPSEAALEAFGQRQLRVARLQWADQTQGYRLIEALKAMADRHGWDQRVPSRLPTPERVRLLKERLVAAQLARLAAAGVAVTGPLAADRAKWSSKRLESAAAELAERIRGLPAPS